jgi:REP element-mobilizing transposase RayT
MRYKPLHIPGHLYFVTIALIEWLPLFSDHSYASIALQSLDWHRRNKRFFLYAFVIMPTHLHWICQPKEPYTINIVLQSFASFTAHEILKKIRQIEHYDWLNIFAKYAKPDKQHRIWQTPLAENIVSFDFLAEKLEYIHNNPVAKLWDLSTDRADYHYSSACFYDRDETPIIRVDDVRNLFV